MQEPVLPAADTPAVARRDPTRWLLALYLLTAVAVAVQRTLVSTENNFAIFTAAARHLRAGQDLYAAYPLEHADFFKYSPTFALLFTPFAAPSAVVGYALFATVCALAVWAGYTRLLPPRQAAVALGLAWISVVGDLQRGQTNALCAGLMLLAWDAYERRGQVAAASAIAVGAFVKLFPVAALAGAIFHPRKVRFAFVTAGVFVVGTLVPLLATTPASLRDQYRSWFAIESHDAVPLTRYGTGGADLYAGIMGQFRVWWGVDWPHWPVQLAGMAILLLPLAVGWRRYGERLFRTRFLASILVFCVLFNHQAESPSYSIAMIGAALWVVASPRAGWRTALFAFALVVVNLASTDLMPRALYKAYYVKYMLKTVPLIPLWLVMQAELLGLIRDRGSSEIAEADQGDARPLEARA
ncbi:MAG: DUF2029 domain-containing protein [Gemmatimonadetes bacterium]|nr:DUF2029 domain-containing protein [Gemmatimonadota bacterium]